MVCLEYSWVMLSGSGIKRADLAGVVQKYCTSKIGGLEDLNKLQTLGFRYKTASSCYS